MINVSSGAILAAALAGDAGWLSWTTDRASARELIGELED
jgi:hypothetical protein